LPTASVSFTFDDLALDIQPSAYINKVPDEKICFSGFVDLVQPADENDETFSMGLNFLRDYYTVFRRERIGFAKAVV
jgi:hypothetical protein